MEACEIQLYSGFSIHKLLEEVCRDFVDLCDCSSLRKPCN